MMGLSVMHFTYKNHPDIFQIIKHLFIGDRLPVACAEDIFLLCAGAGQKTYLE
jgi:hypothetical protein